MKNVTIDNIAYCLEEDYAFVFKYIRPEHKTDFDEVYLQESVEGLSVIGIGAEAFMWARIRELHLPDSIRFIANKAFFGSAIAKVTGGKGLIIVGESAFESSVLEEFPFHEGLLKIKTRAFCSSSFMEAVELPASLTDLGISSFSSATRSIAMHGSTQITYPDNCPAPSDHFSFAPPRSYTIEPPFTKTISERGLIMSADRSIAYAVNGASEGPVSIPGSIREILPYCLVSEIGRDIVFEYSDAPLTAHINELKGVETIHVYRPLRLEIGKIADYNITLICHAPVTANDSDSSYIFDKIIIRPGGSFSIDEDTDLDDYYDDSSPVATLDIEYRGEHPYIPTIFCGKTLIPESTVKIGTIKALDREYYSLVKENMEDHAITLRCTTPPQINKVERGAMQPFTLIVPKGCVPAYSAHRQWGRCEIITDGFGTIIDRSKHQFSTLKKKEMLTKLAQNAAEKLARATFPEPHDFNHSDVSSIFTVQIPTSDPLHPYADFRCEISLDRLGNPDTWAQIRAEVDHIADFISKD